MGNKSCRRHYAEFIDDLESFASSGSTSPGFSARADKAWAIQRDHLGFQPDLSLAGDFSRSVHDLLHSLANLRGRRSRRLMDDSKLEMSSELDAYYELQLIDQLVSDFIIPTGLGIEDKRSSDFAHTVVNEALNLSIAYVNSLAQSAADEYMDVDSVFPSKVQGTLIARSAYGIKDSFRDSETRNDELERWSKNFNRALSGANPDALRDFKLVPVKPKAIKMKERSIDSLIQSLPGDYVPDFITPVANGGTELGVRLDYFFSENGGNVIGYPLLYSVKTRRQNYPWTQYDQEFFSKIGDKSILVAEDWVTSGKTLAGITDEIRNYGPSDVRAATVKRDPASEVFAGISDLTIYSGMVSKYNGKKSDGSDGK